MIDNLITWVLQPQASRVFFNLLMEVDKYKFYVCTIFSLRDKSLMSLKWMWTSIVTHAYMENNQGTAHW